MSLLPVTTDTLDMSLALCYQYWILLAGEATRVDIEFYIRSFSSVNPKHMVRSSYINFLIFLLLSNTAFYPVLIHNLIHACMYGGHYSLPEVLFIELYNNVLVLTFLETRIVMFWQNNWWKPYSLRSSFFDSKFTDTFLTFCVQMILP